MRSKLSFYPKSMYAKMLVTFTILISLLVIGLSSFFYYNYTQSSIRIINRMNDKMLSQISYSTTYMNDIARNFTNSVYFNNAIIPLMFAENEDLFTMNNAIHNLDSQVIRNSYIYSAYTFNRKLDTFISTENNSFYSQKSFYDQEIVEMINSIHDESLKMIPIPRMIPLRETADNKLTTVNVYSYLMFPPMNNDSSTVDSAIVINVKADWLLQTIAGLKMKSESNSDIAVIDAAGRIVSDASADQFLKDISGVPVMKRIMDSIKVSDSFVEKIDGKRMIVNFYKLDNLQWTFISFTPYESIFCAQRTMDNRCGLPCNFTGRFMAFTDRFAHHLLSHGNISYPHSPADKRIGGSRERYQ